MSLCESVENNKISKNLNNKCGVITFCIQLNKKIYALNCLYCQQICLQWETFISHMETKHKEEHIIKEKDEKQNNVFNLIADMVNISEIYFKHI